jgi:hypothetical protein
MTSVTFSVADDAGNKLAVEIEKLKVQCASNIKIHYPIGAAYKLGIAEHNGKAKYSGHDAFNDGFPRLVRIDFSQPSRFK